ncbi:MAG: hypothetical protein AAGA56_27250, partial [Myxococcota bacterium]
MVFRVLGLWLVLLLQGGCFAPAGLPTVAPKNMKFEVSCRPSTCGVNGTKPAVSVDVETGIKVGAGQYVRR